MEAEKANGQEISDALPEAPVQETAPMPEEAAEAFPEAVAEDSLTAAQGAAEAEAVPVGEETPEMPAEAIEAASEPSAEGSEEPAEENAEESEAFSDEAEDETNEETAEGERISAPARRKRKTGRTVIWVSLGLLLLLVCAGIMVISYFAGKITHLDPSTQDYLSPSEIAWLESSYWASVNGNETEADTTKEGEEPEPGSTETEASQERYVRAPFQADAYRATLSADDEQVIFDHPVSFTWIKAEPLKDEDLINIMLVGQDTRNADTRERSDTMILVSINPKTRKVAMISFLRDMLVPLGGDYGMNRLNVAYKIGGFPYMYQVFEDLYGLHIDGGICVNFGQFITAVDILGGVDVTLTQTEAEWLIKTLEQSVPEMRYWGQIVEAQMPKIEAGTTVKKAIEALEKADLTYDWSDMNGGAAPDDPEKATVKSLWIDAACETAAKTGKYYNLQQKIYITYGEDRAVFPKLAENLSAASTVTLLKSCGFKTAYSNKNGNTAPLDDKAALVTLVSTDAAGTVIPEPGSKFDMDTVLYITYTENLANIPTMTEDTTITEAEALLRAAGLTFGWTDDCGGRAPRDRSKATLAGVYSDKEATKPLKAGDKLNINSTVYLSYREDMARIPSVPAGTTVEAAQQALTAAGFAVAYAEANNGAAPRDASTATVTGITTDAAGTMQAEAGTWLSLDAVLYIAYEEAEPTTQEATEPGTEESTSAEEPTTPEATEPETTQEESTSAEEPTTQESSEAPESSSEAETTAEQTSTAPEEPTTQESPSETETETDRESGESTEASASGRRTAIRMVYNPLLTSSGPDETAAPGVPGYLAGIKAGKVHLSGMQALAYCRMRKLDNDFKRTERQRQVLNLLFTKVKTSDAATLRKLLDELLPQVATDMTTGEIMSIAAQVLPYFSSMQINSYYVPAAGTWLNTTYNGMAIVQSDQEANINAIKSWLPF